MKICYCLTSVECLEGQFSTDGKTCVPCLLDTYQDTTGQGDCKPCASDHFTTSSGSTRLSDCIGKKLLFHK